MWGGGKKFCGQWGLSDSCKLRGRLGQGWIGFYFVIQSFASLVEVLKLLSFQVLSYTCEVLG